MIFESEEVRGKFHDLPTQKQFEWSQVEEYLSRFGMLIHIMQVNRHHEGSEVIVRIDDKLKVPDPINSSAS